VEIHQLHPYGTVRGNTPNTGIQGGNSFSFVGSRHMHSVLVYRVMKRETVIRAQKNGCSAEIVAGIRKRADNFVQPILKFCF
jgi:hypothetical protein